MVVQQATRRDALKPTGHLVEAFGETRNLEGWAENAAVCRGALRRRLASMHAEVALHLPAHARVKASALPGTPGSWTWWLIDYEDDPWAQQFVAAHPDGATLEQVGAALGIVRERVRQLEESAIRKCRRAAQKLGAEALAVLEEWELARRRIHPGEAP